MTHEEVNAAAHPGEAGNDKEELEGGSGGYEPEDPFSTEESDESN